MHEVWTDLGRQLKLATAVPLLKGPCNDSEQSMFLAADTHTHTHTDKEKMKQRKVN